MGGEKAKSKSQDCCVTFKWTYTKIGPPYMDHLCGPGPWTLLWTRWTNPRGPPLIFEDEFLSKV